VCVLKSLGSVRVRVTLRLAIYRQSVRLGAKTLESHGQFFFFSIEHLRSQTLCNILSDERMGLSFKIVAGPRQRIHSQVRFPFYSLIFESPQRGGQVPVFLSLRSRVAQPYPQALGSLSVAFYDSQGYGSGIRSRLHTLEGQSAMP
jgi:hypothetical protein